MPDRTMRDTDAFLNWCSDEGLNPMGLSVELQQRWEDYRQSQADDPAPSNTETGHAMIADWACRTLGCTGPFARFKWSYRRVCHPLGMWAYRRRGGVR